MLEKAIEIDPNYAPAHAGLSDVLGQIYEWHGGDDSDLERAEWHSKKALSLSPGMAESHVSYGFVLSLQKRFKDAEDEFKKAIRLNPKAFNAYYRYGRYCFAHGNFEKSAELFQKASEVRLEDFQSPILHAQSLNILKNGGAEEALSAGLRRVRNHLELNPTDRRALSLGASALMQHNEKDEALKWMNLALKLYPEDGGIIFNGACMFALNGDKEKALDLLEVAIEKGYGNKEWLDQDPDYDSLRKEPRFIALMEKLEEKYP